MTNKTKTLKVACQEFVEHLKNTGTAAITANNYARILGLFIAYLGKDKPIADISVRNVGDFYRSKPATMKTLKNGTQVARAESSYQQIRRDVRLALCWFMDQGWIDTVPLPPDERRFLEEKPDDNKPIKAGKKSKEKIKSEVAKVKPKSKISKDSHVKNMKTCDTDNVQPITELASETVLHIISEPVKVNGEEKGTIEGQSLDPDNKLRLV